MITERQIKILELRMYLLNLGCCSPCNWDREKGKVKPSGTYSFCNWWIILFGASVYTSGMTYRIYRAQKIVFGSDPDNEKTYLISATGKKILASLIFLTIDALAWTLIVNLIGVGILISQKRAEVCDVTNAILDLNKWFLKKIAEEVNDIGLHRGGDHSNSRRMNATETMFAILAVATIAVAALYGVTILHPYEPVHRTLEEWFEITPKPDLNMLFIMFLVDWGLFLCGNSIFIPVAMGILYISLCHQWIPGITINSCVLFQGKMRYSTQLGLLSSNTIVQFYRSQQVMNVAINDIVKSKWASFHHATILVISVLSAYLCIHYTEDVRSMGVAGLILPVALFLCILIEYYETHFLGKILKESRQFIKIGLRLTRGRRHEQKILHKFFLSCTDIKLRTAHPFFVVSYDTFLLVLHQGIDFLVSMLVFGAD